MTKPAQGAILVSSTREGVQALLTLQIETTNRWDALALVHKLPRYRWYMFEPDARHWDVCVPLEEPVAELPDDFRLLIEAWVRERNLESASIRLGESTFEVGAGG